MNGKGACYVNGIFLYMYVSALHLQPVFVLSQMRATGLALVRSNLRDAKYIPKFDYRKESFTFGTAAVE